jgi:hypothetical protein
MGYFLSNIESDAVVLVSTESDLPEFSRKGESFQSTPQKRPVKTIAFDLGRL